MWPPDSEARVTIAGLLRARLGRFAARWDVRDVRGEATGPRYAH